MPTGARYGGLPAVRKTSDLRVRVGGPKPATHRSARRETRATAEGEIERGGTRRVGKFGLHMGKRGTRCKRARAVVHRKSRKTLTFDRAVHANLR
jgi:hypothetical protein